MRAPSWFVGISPGARRLLGLAALAVGLFLAWRTYQAHGTNCLTPYLGPDTPSSCTATAWNAWYRWPGTLLGGVLALLGALVLAHALLEARAAARGRRGRRAS